MATAKAKAAAPKAEPEQTTAVSAITDDRVKHLQSLATKALDAEDDYKTALKSLLEQLYLFQKTHRQPAIEAYLQERGLKVTAKSNAFTAVCKLAFATQEGDKWVVTDANNTQISRYSLVLSDYSSEATEKTLSEWIGDRSLNAMVSDARAGKEIAEQEEADAPAAPASTAGDTPATSGDATAGTSTGKGKATNDVKTLVEPYSKKLNAALKEKPQIKLDLATAGITAGHATILCSVDEQGNTTLLGVAQATDTQIKKMFKKLEEEQAPKKMTVKEFAGLSDEQKIAVAELIKQLEATGAPAA